MNTLPHMFMKPEDIAAQVAFLASDESRYMTGSQIVVDMGNTAR
jgi:3(or 17)beta-hydroxysteroid dehydrogenase